MFKELWIIAKKMIGNKKGFIPGLLPLAATAAGSAGTAAGPLAFLTNPAFWSGMGGAGGFLGGISKMFGGKKKGGEDINIEAMLPSWMRESAQGLSGWAKNYMGNFVPGEKYGGKFAAGTTGIEETGLGQLEDFMKTSGIGDAFSAGKGQIMDTLGGKFMDPKTSPFIKSMIDMSKMNLTDIINQARARRGGRGSFYTTKGIEEEARLGERSQNYLNTVIGDFVNKERGRMFQAAPLAQMFDKYERQDVPLRKVGASQTFGALERLIEQSELEGKYKDYTRQRNEMTMPLHVAQGLSGQQPFMSKMTSPYQEESNPLANILKMISKLNFGKSGAGGGGNWMESLSGLFNMDEGYGIKN